MAASQDRTTPGVYVTERDAFPSSIVGVQTAIPAFIGYTEKAELNGKPISGTPAKINSLADYEELFGVGPKSIYNIEEVPPAAATAVQDANAAPETPPASSPPNESYDFSCLRQTAATPPVWTLKYYKLTPVDAAKSRTSVAGEPAFAPFILYNAVRLFYANGGGACYIVSVGSYVDGTEPATVQYAPLKKGLDAVKDQSGPTMLVIPDAVLLPPAAPDDETPTSSDFSDLCKDMLNQCGELTDRVAILDVYGAETLDQHHAGWELRMEALVENFQAGVGEKFLSYGMAYFPMLVTSIVKPAEIDYTDINIADDAQCALLQAILNDQADLIYGNDPATCDTVKGYVAAIKTTQADGVAQLNATLLNALALLAQIENIIVMKASLLPPSAAMAGVYTFTDTTRGVWNAPANIVLSSVIAPNVTLNNDQQGSLNLPLNGKSIDVIRQFVGRGSVVWGARTLDGNSLDWRYIQVRRTIIYIEQSIETALQPFAFAANDGATWSAATAMVSNFLQGVWAQGGLMGAKADEAFTVACGLGNTMTPQDILEGSMIVQVTLQMIRPAEFIVLTFKQRMQGLV